MAEPAEDAAAAGGRLVRVADAGAAGWRLDAWLASALADADDPPTRSRLQKLIRDGRVAVDGDTEREAKRKLRGGERAEVALPPPEPATPTAQAIELAIIHEDEDLVVVDKPVGMVVHPGAGVPDGTLVNALLHHCGSSLAGIGGVARPGIVHRLDRDTSGVMVVAKTDLAHASLSAQFADHGRSGPLERAYLALVWGSPVPPAGIIDAPLRRSPTDRTKRAVGEGADSRHAVTHYSTVRPLGSGSLLRCRLETGRTHQIRVHMAHVGHPLVGDRTYGASQATRARRLSEKGRSAVDALPGQALHAALLAFAHPRTGSTMRFETEPPETFRVAMEALESEAG